MNNQPTPQTADQINRPQIGSCSCSSGCSCGQRVSVSDPLEDDIREAVGVLRLVAVDYTCGGVLKSDPTAGQMIIHLAERLEKFLH